MKMIDDIFKERLEAYESSLPEGGLADFRKKLSDSRQQQEIERKKFPAFWVMLPAALAVAALVLVIGKPAETITDAPLPAGEYVAAAPPQTVIETPEVPQAEKLAQNAPIADKVVETESSESSVIPEYRIQENPAQPDPELVPEEPVLQETMQASPFIPEAAARQSHGNLKLVLSSGGMLGLGVAGLLASIPVTHEIDNRIPTPPDGTRYVGADYRYLSYYGMDGFNQYSKFEYRHSRPFRMGLSLRFPISDSFSIVSGIGCSSYKSRLNVNGSSEYNQIARYLELPVRLDYRISGNRWLDIYMGAGMSADVCVRATLNGEQIDKDGLSFSFMGAGGVQLNLLKNAGLFIEPQLSWSPKQSNAILRTYRTENPLMFSLSTGLRVTINSK